MLIPNGLCCSIIVADSIFCLSEMPIGWAYIEQKLSMPICYRLKFICFPF